MNGNRPKSLRTIRITLDELFENFPCSVCNASSSSGIHFGAVTCSPCKAFFRRTIKERNPQRYKCMELRDCQITVQTRNSCRFCRYQACLRAGMSAEKRRSRDSILRLKHLQNSRSASFAQNVKSYQDSSPEAHKKCDVLSETGSNNQRHFANNLEQPVTSQSAGLAETPIQEDSNVPDSLADALKSLGVKCHVGPVPDLAEKEKLAKESEIASFVDKCVKSLTDELFHKNIRIACMEQETARLTAKIAELEAGKQSGVQSESHCAGEGAKPQSYNKRLRSSRKAINYRN